MKKGYFTLFLIVCFQFAKAQCSDLFFSEYIEGYSFNKVIEIFNPTPAAITLDDYQLQTYSNGSDTASFKFTLHGQLASMATYVIANSQADSLAVLPLTDTTSIACIWNGDDAVVLWKISAAMPLDVIGIVGADPGTYWAVDTGSTQDHDLVRKADVQQATTDWGLGATQWNVFGPADFSHLGTHSMNPCEATALAFSAPVMDVDEDAGTFSVEVDITNANAAPTSVDVNAIDISATNGADYNFPVFQTITFPAYSVTPITLDGTITDDATAEPDEVFELQLTNPTNNAVLTGDVIKVTIIDNDGLGIESEGGESGIEVYPTLSTGSFTLETARATDMWLYNALGKVVWRGRSVSGTASIHPDGLTAGIYFFRAQCGDALIIKKVIIQ